MELKSLPDPDALVRELMSDPLIQSTVLSGPPSAEQVKLAVSPLSTVALRGLTLTLPKGDTEEARGERCLHT